MLGRAPQKQTFDPPAPSGTPGFASIFTDNLADQGALKRSFSDSEAAAHVDGWQFASIDTIASAVMQTPREIESLVGKDWTEAPDHPLHTLLEDANVFMTGEEVLYWLAVELMISGRSFWRIVTNGIGEPAEIWPVVGKMQPIPDPQKFIAGWKETFRTAAGTTQSRTHAPEEIIYLRIPKVGDIYGGVGRVQAAASAIMLENQLEDAEWRLFKQGVFPFAIVGFDEADPQKRDSMIEHLRSAASGLQNLGGAFGYEKGHLDVTFAPQRQLDVGWDKGAERVRDKIVAVLRTPLALMGHSKEVNRASAEALEYVFAKWCVGPLIKLVQARLNQDLARRYYDKTRICFRHVIPADKDYQLREEQMALTTGAIVINEWRAIRGMEAVDWGDRPILPLNLLPLGSTLPATPAAGGNQGLSTQAAAGYPARTRRAILERHGKHSAPVHKRVARDFRDLFNAITQEVLLEWEDARDEFAADGRITLMPARTTDQTLDVGRLAARIAAAGKPAMRYGLVLGGDFERSILGLDEDTHPWGEGIAEMEHYAAQWGAQHWESTARTLRLAYMDTVTKGIQDGATWDELRLAIAEKFGQLTESHVANIATTETTKLYGAGGQGFRSQYEIDNKQWVTSFVNSRDTHMAADGQVRRNNDPFDIGADTMDFPGGGSLAEENCNCNCAAVGLPGETR